METLSSLQSLVVGNPPVIRQEMWNFDACFDIGLSKILNKLRIVDNLGCHDAVMILNMATALCDILK